MPDNDPKDPPHKGRDMLDTEAVLNGSILHWEAELNRLVQQSLESKTLDWFGVLNVHKKLLAGILDVVAEMQDLTN